MTREYPLLGRADITRRCERVFDVRAGLAVTVESRRYEEVERRRRRREKKQQPRKKGTN